MRLRIQFIIIIFFGRKLSIKNLKCYVNRLRKYVPNKHLTNSKSSPMSLEEKRKIKIDSHEQKIYFGRALKEVLRQVAPA